MRGEGADEVKWVVDHAGLLRGNPTILLIMRVTQVMLKSDPHFSKRNEDHALNHQCSSAVPNNIIFTARNKQTLPAGCGISVI